MERGRPVIAARVGGLGEIVVDGETGLLVPSGEIEPLRAAIVELARHLGRAAELGRAGRRRAVAEFSEERCIERTEALYRSALDTP
jgi:starch synthase